MQQPINDWKLQRYLRRVIDELPYNQRLQLKNIRNCNTHAIPQSNGTSAVFLLRGRNSGKGKFFGSVTCKNTWACPCCTAATMSKYAAKIAAAIEGLKREGYYGVMLTLTIPHLKFQSCKEVTDILYKTYEITFKNAYKVRYQKDGVTPRYHNAFNKFCVETGVKYWFRVGEYTYGANGWHPHFHMIFFVPRRNFSKVLQYEKALNESWQNAFKHHAVKYWTQKNIFDDKRKNLLEYTAKELIGCDKDGEILKTVKNVSVKFSRNKKGKVLQANSSAYICGWGADKELTGNKRKEASHTGHLTPYQILEKAAAGDTEMEKLYIEFCLQTTRKPIHCRTRMSMNGLNRKIKNYMQQDGFKRLIKKKSQTEKMDVVCWFTNESWRHLCQVDQTFPIIEKILFYVEFDDRRLLYQLLEDNGIDYNLSKHVAEEAVLKLFNDAA